MKCFVFILQPGGGGLSKAQLASIAKLEEQVFVLTKEKEALEQNVANSSDKVSWLLCQCIL